MCAKPIPFYLCPTCGSILVLEAGRFVCKKEDCLSRDKEV